MIQAGATRIGASAGVRIVEESQGHVSGQSAPSKVEKKEKY
jgi:deoxyribose-phosphate aldolase